MKKISVFVVYFISFLYMELLFRFLLLDNLFSLSLINLVIFVFCFALFLSFISRLLGEKIGKIIFFLIMSITSLWFCAQYVVKSFLDFYISFSVLQIAGQVGDFLLKALLETFKRSLVIFLFFLPLIISVIYRKNIWLKKNNIIRSLTILVGLILASFSFYFSLFIKKEESASAYNLTFNVNNIPLTIEKLGVINAFFIDTYRLIFPLNEKIVTIPSDDEPIEEEIKYDYNILDIDFEALTRESDDEIIKSMSQYLLNDASLQNEYTGFFKGKNLILLMAESFNEVAVKENITPTIYKLVNNGFVFENFYTPTISSTIGGEFQQLTGLYAVNSNLPIFKKGTNDFPFGIATLFQNAGYKTFAYHNNSYSFQNRNLYLKSLGFQNFKACYNGLEKLINCALWPQSDVEMIEATINDYTSLDEPFMVFYSTVSGHASYSFNSNSMAKKHEKEIKMHNLGYTQGPLSYLAAQMEFDKALETLINKLSEKNLLDDTVIAFVGDHYPYELTVEQINEIATYKKDDTIEINRSNFAIYNSNMENVYVKKVGSQIDVLPTLYNLFGLEYDSRLIVGKDILSPSEGLAIFGDRSWISDKGAYFASKDEFIPKENVSEDYIFLTNQIVNNKINISKYIMEKNYYNIAFKYLKK